MADMSDVSLPVPIDGRQSERALAIARGTLRMLRQLDYAGLQEFTLADGRRADICALGQKGEIWIIEVKSSIADFRADEKWQDYLAFCDRFSFAVGPDFPAELIPVEVGLIVADKYGAEILREAPPVPLAAARRKAVTQRFARVSAYRLNMLFDPEGWAC